jgi:hypothetical protein
VAIPTLAIPRRNSRREAAECVTSFNFSLPFQSVTDLLKARFPESFRSQNITGNSLTAY